MINLIYILPPVENNLRAAVIILVASLAYELALIRFRTQVVVQIHRPQLDGVLPERFARRRTGLEFRRYGRSTFAPQPKGWEVEPVLVSDLKFKGDFRKHLVFVEVQFGNSAALYRDYYKFQYGLANGLLSLAVLIVPLIPEKFFPTRPSSVRNMADYRLAMKCFTILPIRVPTLLIGLIPKN